MLLGIKVAGVEFLPRDLVFAAPEPKSRATADGPLPNECGWSFVSETRVAKREDDKGCVRYYYKTTVTLQQSCPAPEEKKVTRSAERITSPGLSCPDGSGHVPPPASDARVLSTGTTADGRHQDILVQPDGTRITVSYDATGATCAIGFPDGSGDTLKVP